MGSELPKKSIINMFGIFGIVTTKKYNFNS